MSLFEVSRQQQWMLFYKKLDHKEIWSNNCRGQHDIT